MITLSLQKAAGLLGCPFDEDDMQFSGISSDSRVVEHGMMFAALSGERADGHDFAASAMNSGAVAILAEKRLDLPIPHLVVDDVLIALGTLAGYWRNVINPCVVAITGSNGKTTTREMVTNILELNASVHSTSGNYNNELGMPLTLFGLNSDHRYAVLELGASKAGDIAYLGEISAPDVGVVTNIGPAHLQGFGNEEGVARAKGELFAALPGTGSAVINAEEQWSAMWREMCPAQKIITFGHDKESDVYPEISETGVRVQTPTGSFPLQLHLPGAHNVQNALAATAVALTLNIPLDQVREGLENTRPIPGRLNLIHTQPGWTVIDDTYNANPASLFAALQVLSLQHGEPWLVLGDMNELGPGSRKMHCEMGESARALGVKRIFAVGDATVFSVDAFGSGARHFGDHESLIKVLRSELRPGISCLVKGSRSMGMEQVVEAITGAYTMREAG